MGLFSSKKKTVVSSQIYNLAGDKIEEFIPLSILSSVYMNPNPQISLDLVKSITSSPGFKLRNYIYWLKHNDTGQEYMNMIAYQAPSFTLSNATSQDIEQALRDELIGSDITHNLKIDTSEISGANYQYWGAKYIAENYPQYADETQYGIECDFDSNQNNKITIKIFDLVHPIEPVTETPPKQAERIKYEQEESDELFEDRYPLVQTYEYNATDYKENILCLYIAYQYYPLVRKERQVPYGLEGETRTEVYYDEPESLDDIPMTYFIYQNVDDDDPGYNIRYAALFSSPISEGQQSAFIVPPIPIRIDNYQLSSNTEDRKYFLVKKAFFKVFQDYSTYRKLDKQLLENESIGDLDYIYLTFGVSINTKNWAGKRYLFEFAKLLSSYDEDYGSKSIYLNCQQGYANFNQQISWDRLFYGVALSDEEFQSTEGFLPTVHKKGYEVCHHTEIEEYIIEYADGNETATRTLHFIYFIHKEQNQYEYIKASGLHHSNYVHSGKTTNTKAENAKWNPDADDYEESPFIFPIHEGIYRAMPAAWQAQMSQSFAYLLFNCYVTKKIKWYQTGFFKIFVMIVVIIIVVVVSICTYGSGSGPSSGWAASVYGGLTAAGVGATTAAIITALAKVVVTAVASILVSKLVTAGLIAIGIDARIASIAGTIAGVIAGAAAAGAFDPGSIQTGTTSVTETTVETIGNETAISSVSSTTPSFATTASEGAFGAIHNIMTSPMQLMNLGLQLFNSGTQAHFQHEGMKLQKKQAEIQEIQKQTQNIYQELEDFTTQFSEWASKYTLWKLQTSMSPDDFFFLTLATGTDYADMTLRYPSLSLEPNLNLSGY